MMRTIAAFAFAFGLAAWPASAARVEVADGLVSLDLPDGLAPLTDQAIAELRASRPQFAFANAEADVVITVNVNDWELPPDLSFTAAATLMDDIVRRSFDIVGLPAIETVSRDWRLYQFRNLSGRAQREIDNLILATLLDGQVVWVTADATAARFPEWEAPLRAALDSVEIAD